MWALAALTLLVSPLVAQDAQSFDLIIRGGRIVDGTGNPWVRAGETGSLETAPTATQSCRCSHSGSLEVGPRFPRWIQAIAAVTGAVPER